MNDEMKTITCDSELIEIGTINKIYYIKFESHNDKQIIVRINNCKFNITLYKTIDEILKDIYELLSNKTIKVIYIDKIFENVDLSCFSNLKVVSIIINKYCSITIPKFINIKRLYLNDSNKIKYGATDQVINLTNLPSLKTIVWDDTYNLGDLPEDNLFNHYKIKLIIGDTCVAFALFNKLTWIKCIKNITIVILESIHQGTIESDLKKHLKRNTNIKKLCLKFDDYLCSKCGTIYGKLYEAMNNNKKLEKAKLCIESIFINDLIKFNDSQQKLRFTNININDFNECYHILLNYDYDTLKKLFCAFIKRMHKNNKYPNNQQLMIILNNICKYTRTLVNMHNI